MAGTRQYNNLLALFENWSMYEKSVRDSATATGFLQEQQEKYLDSVEAHLEQLSAAGERVYDALFDSKSTNNLIDILTDFVTFFGNAIESIGGGGTLLMAILPVMTKLFSGSLASGMATFVTNIQNA